MNAGQIMFLRAFCKELVDRANGWARDGSNAASPDIRDRFNITASVLRDLVAAVEAAMKATVLG